MLNKRIVDSTKTAFVMLKREVLFQILSQCLNVPLGVRIEPNFEQSNCEDGKESVSL